MRSALLSSLSHDLRTPLVSISKVLATGDDYQVFNGFCGAESGYVPVSYKDAVRAEGDFPSRAALRYLKRLKVKYVILEGKRYDPARFARILQRVKRNPGLVPRYQSDGYFVYELR